MMASYFLLKSIKKRIEWMNDHQAQIEAQTTTSEPLGLSALMYMMDDEAEKGSGLELLLFDFSTISAATENFHEDNKLGEGGFGPVYKGKLPKGPEVAVKRLSKRSGQGLKEFKNEVVLISKLQHRNLVRLLGFCIDGEEKMLLYEFMPNKSLDAFLFDETKRGLLDWPKRYIIIEGVARGLLYLHRDSRLRIIHRDLKASNILLDGKFNAKISDFGMARIFNEDQILGTTMKVVGTIGYMSPEYAMEGNFSEKSDVFSFGVLLLEIVSGKKNNYIFDAEEDNIVNLLGLAWNLWTKDKAFELLDTSVCESISHSEVMKCIHVGLLCVQQYPRDRPSMSLVVSMLNGDTNLPPPKKAVFFGRSTEDSTSNNEKFSTTSFSITDVHSR